MRSVLSRSRTLVRGDYQSPDPPAGVLIFERLSLGLVTQSQVRRTVSIEPSDAGYIRAPCPA
jgi:hypothetical protein